MLLVFATHPFASNGYAKVVYNILRNWHCDNVALFAFQNLYPDDPGNTMRVLPATLTKVHDAYAHEDPKAEGFGISKIPDVLREHMPDTVLIYSDMVIVRLVTDAINNAYSTYKDTKKPRIVVYLDQVYPYQKPDNVRYINENVDCVVTFSPAWEATAKALGVKVPVRNVPHGFDPDAHPVIPTTYARHLLGLTPSDFIVLNLNRNQPRKRWDTCLAAWAEFVSRNRNAPVRMLIGTSPVAEAWDLTAIYANELRKRGITLEEGLKHVILMEKPQRATDAYVNLLYNACDIGINTSDGEGFGLCQLEHACLGKPQIVPRLGAFPDIFDDDCAIFVEPRINYYLDFKRDGVGGEASMALFSDYTDAIETYWNDTELRRQHGLRCKNTLPVKFNWKDIARNLGEVMAEMNSNHPISMIKPDPRSPEACGSDVASCSRHDHQ
jgi:glycosyltransferase involved in cell wall biosynthesis